MHDLSRPGIKEIMNLKLIFSLLFFEHRYPEFLPEGSVSQIFVLGLSFDFMSKNG